MNIYSFASLIASLFCLILGILIFIKRQRDKRRKFFGIASILTGLWTLFPFIISMADSAESALLFARFIYLPAIFVAPTWLHFTFSVVREGLSKKKKKILILSYGISLIFLFFSFSPDFIKGTNRFMPYFSVVPGPVYTIFIAVFNLIFYFSIRTIFKGFRISTGHHKNQLKYILFSFLFGFLGGVLHFGAAYFNSEPFPHDFLLIGYTGLMAYAILRYRLLDIYLAIKKTAVYSLSAGLLMGFFVVVTLTITKFLTAYTHVDSFKVSTFVAFISALFLFNPIRNKIQEIIDKLFYKKTYDYYGTLQKVSHDLAAMFDLKKIYSFIGDTIFSTLGLKSIYLLSAGSGGDYEVVYDRAQSTEHRQQTNEKTLKINGNSDMIRLLKTSDDVVIKDELPGIVEILGQETIDNISNTMKPFNGEVVVPVFIDDKLSLLIVLSGKLSGDIFSDEDVNVLKTVSNQTAIAIKNASFYAEKLRSERFASIGMMSATFAHEIRNPLTSIKTFAQLFPDKYTDTEFREIFSKIVIDDVERIDGLIKDLLNFSGEKTFPRMNEIEIVSLIDEILNYLKNKLELENKKISVEKVYKDVKINILGDSEKLKQAFINIITNGCQAMGENGVLKVNITPNGREVDIAISDTGKGISQEEISRLFDPFYTTKPMGMGLGLAISKKIIEDHGGRIIVESEISKGTTFTVSLPMKNEGA
ncbi:MAG: ATP-binding protein [Thermodesulfovibrionia bacterium]|nr:ATP-binding protein [Thermodesulfovibrionia bacterium]